MAVPMVPRRQGRLWLSVIRTPTEAPVSSSRRVRNPAADASGFCRQQQGALAVAVLDIRLIDAGVGADETQSVPDDEHPGPLPHDVRGLIENELHQPRVLVGFPGQACGFRAGLYACKRNGPAFRLRHDFLGDATPGRRRQARARPVTAPLRSRPRDRRLPGSWAGREPDRSGAPASSVIGLADDANAGVGDVVAPVLSGSGWRSGLPPPPRFRWGRRASRSCRPRR